MSRNTASGASESHISRWLKMWPMPVLRLHTAARPVSLCRYRLVKLLLLAQRMGMIIPVEDINTLGDIITNYNQIVAGMGHSMSSNNTKFNAELEKLVNEMI